MAKNSNKAVAISAETEWMVSRDLEALLEAEKIQKDPKRMAKVKALAKKRMMDHASIASSEED